MKKIGPVVLIERIEHHAARLTVTKIALVFLACFGVIEHLIRTGALLAWRNPNEYSLFAIADYVLYWLKVIPYPSVTQGAVPQYALTLGAITFIALLVAFVLCVFVGLVNALHIFVRLTLVPNAECASLQQRYQWAGLYVLAISATFTWSFFYSIPPAFLVAMDCFGGYLYVRGRTEDAQREPIQSFHPVLRWLWYVPTALWMCGWYAVGAWDFLIAPLIPYLLFRTLMYYLFTLILGAKGRTAIRIGIIVMDFILLFAFPYMLFMIPPLIL